MMKNIQLISFALTLALSTSLMASIDKFSLRIFANEYESAVDGNEDLQMKLAMDFFHGRRSLKNNYTKAMFFLEKLSEKNNSKACHYKAWMHYYGIFTNPEKANQILNSSCVKDYRPSLKLLKKVREYPSPKLIPTEKALMDLQDSEAFHHAAKIYYKKGDIAKSEEILSKLSDVGHIASKYILAMHYLSSDPLKAEEILKELANDGHKEAQLELAYYYLNTGDTKLFLKWLDTAVVSENTAAMAARAELWLRVDEFNKAWTLLRRSKELGYDSALYSAVSKIIKLQESANKGSHLDQFKLGKIFFFGDIDGIKINKNLKKSYKYWIMSSNDAESQYLIGEIFYKGEEKVERDYKKAIKWFDKSAEQGYEKAKLMLAVMKYRAEGFDYDPEQSYNELKVLSDNGNSDAKNLLKISSPSLSNLKKYHEYSKEKGFSGVFQEHAMKEFGTNRPSDGLKYCSPQYAAAMYLFEKGHIERSYIFFNRWMMDRCRTSDWEPLETFANMFIDDKDPKRSFDAHLTLVGLYKAQGDLIESLKWIRKMEESSEASDPYNRSWILRAKYELAKEIYEKTQENIPDKISAVNALVPGADYNYYTNSKKISEWRDIRSQPTEREILTKYLLLSVIDMEHKGGLLATSLKLMLELIQGKDNNKYLEYIRSKKDLSKKIAISFWVGTNLKMARTWWEFAKESGDLNAKLALELIDKEISGHLDSGDSIKSYYVLHNFHAKIQTPIFSLSHASSDRLLNWSLSSLWLDTLRP